MTRRYAAALFLACALWIPEARADDAADDAKCLAVALNMASAQDADEQSVGILSTMYWLGRLDGRNPSLDLQKQLSDAADAMTQDDLKTEATRCTATLRARGEELSKLGPGLPQPKPD